MAWELQRTGQTGAVCAHRRAPCLLKLLGEAKI